MSPFPPLRTLLIIGTVAVAALALSVTSAFAQYPPPPAFSVSCAPADPAPGDGVACGVVGAVPGETLVATAEYNPVFYETTGTAADDGTFPFGFTVPLEATGDVIVRVVGSISGELATSVLTVDLEGTDGAGTAGSGDATAAGGSGSVDSVSVTPASGGQLPLTGIQVLSIAAIGLALIGGGLLVLRRREDATSLA